MILRLCKDLGTAYDRVLVTRPIKPVSTFFYAKPALCTGGHQYPSAEHQVHAR